MATRDAAARAETVAALQTALAELDQTTGVHAQRACALLIHQRFGPSVGQSPRGRLIVNRATVRAEARLDGTYLLRTSDDTLSSEDVALGYTQRLEVECGWRDLEHRLDLRPVSHRKDERIEAHGALCFLALLLVRVPEQATGTPWAWAWAELQRVALVDRVGTAGHVAQRTELAPVQTQLFAALAVPPPTRIWAAASSAPATAA